MRRFHLSLWVLSLAKNECISIFLAFSIKWNDASISAMDETLTLRHLIFGILKMMCCFLGVCCFFICVVWNNPSRNRFVFGFIMLCRQCWFWMKFTPQGFILCACLFLCLFIFTPARNKTGWKCLKSFFWRYFFWPLCVFSFQNFSFVTRLWG